MFTLTIAVGNTSWPLVFKTEESAQVASLKLDKSLSDSTQNRQTITDDFGQSATVLTSAVNGWLLEDMEKVRLAHIERQLYAARLQVDTGNAARSDPKLMAAQRGQGPGVITPFNGRMS